MDLSNYTDEELVSKVPLQSQAWFQTPFTLEMQRRLLVSIRDFNAASGKQADKMIALTWAIVALTIALGGIALVQVWIMLKGGA